MKISSELQKRRSAGREFQSQQHMRERPRGHGKRKSEEWRGDFYVKNEVDVMDDRD